jgi:hypothetical protein
MLAYQKKAIHQKIADGRFKNIVIVEINKNICL